MNHYKYLLAAVAAAILHTGTAGAQDPAQGGQERSLPFRHLATDETITVNFQDEDLGAVLEMFSTNYKLNLVYGPDVLGTVTMNFFDAPVEEALRQILIANNFDFEVDGNFILVQALPSKPAGGAKGSAHVPSVFFLNHLRAQDVVPLLQPMLAAGESTVEGFKSQKGIESVTDTGGNEQADREMFVIYAGENTLTRVRALLAEIDRAPPQVLVEATIMSVTLSDDFQLGVDFNAFAGIDFQALGGSGRISDGVSAGDLDTGTNPIDGWLSEVSQRGFTDGASNGLHFGILRNQVGVFIQALEEVGNATVLSNPQILTLNRHAAQLLVGRKLPYLTTTTSQTSTQQSVNFLEVGTSLVFRPYVTEDGYVRMEIHPKKSDGFINSIGLPEESTSEVTTNILVKAGNTIVIGGLMEETLVSSVNQVPLLGSLPWIGTLFRNETQSSVKSEIVVLLTPHIVGDNEVSARGDTWRLRLDSARARLAASHHGYLRPSYARRMYAQAAEALASGDAKTALAKAESGLRAMPADPDLAALAHHCRAELDAGQAEAGELRAAIELIQSSKK
jgi:type IV pilus assembly protein PilQ